MASIWFESPVWWRGSSLENESLKGEDARFSILRATCSFRLERLLATVRWPYDTDVADNSSATFGLWHMGLQLCRGRGASDRCLHRGASCR